MMQKKDERVKKLNEVLHGIRAVKFFGWEGYFADLVSLLRHLEFKKLKTLLYLQAAFVFIFDAIPVLVTVS